MEKIIKVLPRTLILIVIFAGLAACSPIGRVPIDMEQRKTIHQTSEILHSNQKHLEVEKIKPVTPAGTGLIGAVVTATMVSIANARSEQQTRVLRASVDGESFKEQLHRNIVHELKTVKWLNLDNNTIKDSVGPSEKVNIVTHLPNTGDVMIYVDLSYQLSNVLYNVLTVTARVDAYRKDGPKTALVYQNNFKYVDVLEKKGKPEEYLSTWTANGAARAEKALNNATYVLAQAIAKDIQDPSKQPDSKSKTNVWYSPHTPGVGGYLESKKDNQRVIREVSGGIDIINDPNVEIKK